MAVRVVMAIGVGMGMAAARDETDNAAANSLAAPWARMSGWDSNPADPWHGDLVPS